MRYRLIAICCLIPMVVFSQEPEWEDRMGAVEEVEPVVSETLETHQWVLDQFRKKPLDLNRASAPDMEELGLLSPLQIDSWIRFRNQFGNAESWYVFQAVPGWDERTVLMIRPYCKLGSTVGKMQNLFSGERQQLALFRVSWKPAVEQSASVLGTNLSRLFRYRFQSDRGWQAGCTMESDAGETAIRRGPDFFSGFIQWRNERGRASWLLGDYSVQLGQGLICWQGMTFGIGADLTAVKRQGLSIRPYQSVGESRFMRGVALSVNKRNWNGMLFLSGNRQTATLYSLGDGSQGFRQVDASGYHRTQAEHQKKDALLEYTLGSRLSKTTAWGSIAVNLIGRQWSISKFIPAAVGVDTSWMRSVGNMSIDASYTRGNLHAFSEIAVDGSGVGAAVLGLVAVLDRRVDFSAHMRCIGIDFRSVDGQAFQQSAVGKGERGFFTQMRLRVSEKQQIDLFADLYESPEPGFRVGVPFYGLVRGLRWQYQPDKRNGIYLRWQIIQRARDAGDDPMPAVRTLITRSLRLHGQFSLGDRASLSLRAEQLKLMHQGVKDEEGFLAYLEWSRSNTSSGLEGNFRVTWVSTEGWDSRIYAYERDVQYKMGFPAFYGQMLRFYLNLSVPLGLKTKFWIKLSADKNIENQYFVINKGSVQPHFTFQIRHQWSGGAR